MWKTLTVIFSLSLLLPACGGDNGFLSTAKKNVTVVNNTEIIYPSLPDIDKPLPPILRPVIFDYPRDTTKPKVVKATEDCKVQPPITNFEQICMEYPIIKNGNIFIGMNKNSFDNYLSNQEQINGYGRILNSRLDEVNAERAKWRESNQQKEK